MFRACLAAAVCVLTVVPLARPDGVTLSAWVAAAVWFLGLATLIRDGAGVRTTRDLWAAGCWLFLFHAGLAFHAVHGWSHAAAYDHVERGSGFGAGVFVNYLFGLVWAADAAWMWLLPAGYVARPRWVGRAVHGFLAFVVFNAAVVYADGPLRWVALAGFGALAWGAKYASPRRR